MIKLRLIGMILLVLLTVSFAPAVEAGQAILSWQAPTTNEDGTPLTDLAGYKVYYGKVSATYTIIKDIGNVLTYAITENALTYTITGLGEGTWYFVVTAYNTIGTESAYSNEVSKVIKTVPSKPVGCTVQ
uniref:Fibronectin type-III domain-containing protein n=1 Tax=viral metagenome TaxID=1070528 RepID=A0A6M3J749_9ZZZZ